MKKTLMVLTFALCATFVMAQTATPNQGRELKAASTVSTAKATSNSSIFTKVGTPVFTCDFSAANVGYSTGLKTGGLDGHSQNYDYAQWRRIANNDSATIAAQATVYPAMVQNYFGSLDNFVSYLSNYADSATSSAENGFMMMSLVDQTTTMSGNFNAYILFEHIDASSASVLDFRFFQYYRKYYDHCYVDYSTNGSTWTSYEINVLYLDVDVNDALWGFYAYVLPIACAGQSDLSLRLRYYSPESRNSYGYFWLVDDVSVVSEDADRMTIRGVQEYVEGNYGLIPQGLPIDPIWYGYIQNNGSNPRSNVTASLHHLNAAQDTDNEFVSFNNQSIQPTGFKDVIVDRAGRIFYDSVGYRGWYGFPSLGPNGTGSYLPTQTAGDNYVYASVSSDAAVLNLDTMYYKVTTAQNGNYRWGHDLGVLTYNPRNYWLFGFVGVPRAGEIVWYVTEDPEDVHFYSAGYMVTSRYTTADVVPEGWVIRGVELVASPVTNYYSTGTRLSAVLSIDQYVDGGNSVQFPSIVTGANVKQVTSADVNDSNSIGRNSNGYLEFGNYNTVVIEFPEQPELLPNSSYRIGYSIEEDSYFALANDGYTSYRVASPTRPDTYDTIIPYRSNEATAKYAHPFGVNTYQNYFNDPSYGGSDGRSSRFASRADNPMIRMLVGPRQEVARVNISIECDSSEYGTVAYAGQEVCNTTINPAQGGSATITATSARGCGIAHVLLDGQEIVPFDAETEEGDERLIAVFDSTELMYIYQLSLEYLQADHSVKFVFTEQGAQIGIDPAAAGISMNLQPNPATSQVNLNIEGVAGMVNCMLIDMSGRVVYNQNINAENAQVINLNGLAKGAYFVRITNDKFSKVEKLIVR